MPTHKRKNTFKTHTCIHVLTICYHILWRSNFILTDLQANTKAQKHFPWIQWFAHKHFTVHSSPFLLEHFVWSSASRKKKTWSQANKSTESICLSTNKTPCAKTTITDEWRGQILVGKKTEKEEIFKFFFYDSSWKSKNTYEITNSITTSK